MTASIALTPPVPPAHMPLWQRMRPLKRWRYVGVFGERLMLCAASVQVGPARQTFWAIFERTSGLLFERTRLIPRRGTLDLTPGTLRIEDEGIVLDLTLEEQPGIEVVCPHGRSYVWTRKQGGVRACGTLAVHSNPPLGVEGLAVIDDSAGYHARATEWWWAAGVGSDAKGQPLAFNLVQGVNDPASGSERTAWITGAAQELAPVRFSADLSSIRSEDGCELSFVPERERRRKDNLIVVRSEYQAPFGSFSGVLPGGIRVASALGVVEHHRARW